jgi:hypothetical protein
VTAIEEKISEKNDFIEPFKQRQAMSRKAVQRWLSGELIDVRLKPVIAQTLVFIN